VRIQSYSGWFYLPVIIAVAAVTAAVVHADVVQISQSDIESLKTQIQNVLAHQYPGARIDVTGPIKLVHGTLSSPIKKVTWASEPIRGEAHLKVNEAAEISAVYAAFVPARVSKRRISPGEKLTADMFVLRDIDVTNGMNYEMRGIILSQEEDVSRLETRQTILDGQFLTSTAVEKVPDIRKGDSVRIHIVSGDLNLSASGIAMEPGYEKNPIKVLVSRSKHELSGTLEAGGIVEVNLQ
jgi:flagella basal body P-ring formation protein FlgA